MNSKLKLMLLAAAILLSIGSGFRVAHAQGNKGAASASDKTAQGAGCPVLTSAMVEKVLGQKVQSGPAQKIPPMYDGASGLGCRYRSGDVRIDFSVYTEASPVVAKHTFDTYSIAADDSKGKPAIGDSAYWVTDNKQEPYLYVLKGKVHFSIGMSPPDESRMKNLAGTAASGI